VRADAFDSISTTLEKSWERLKGETELSADNIKAPIKDIRRALLEADVSLPVVRRFVKKVEERSLGVRVTKGVTPDQQLVKVVADELLELMGRENVPLAKAEEGPTVVLMAGLQGVGKTTACAKLALRLKKEGRSPLMVGTDVYRPAAIDQLLSLGERSGVPVFELGTEFPPPEIARRGVEHAAAIGADTIIVDTAGRLQIDEDMMSEMQAIKAATGAQETLLVVDAMTGQEAASLTAAFNDAVGITGAVLTKLDGDSRGGAALSVREVSGKPIKFVGVGEKLDALDPFYPERMTSRILGMGDIVSLVEKAQDAVKEEQAQRIAQRVKEAKFDLNDFMEQVETMSNMGSMGQLMKMLPGMNKMTDAQAAEAEENFKVQRSLIQSMTPKEREFPELLVNSQSRRIRVASGAGRTEQEVDDLLLMFGMMRMRMQSLSKMVNAGAADAGMMPELSDEDLIGKAMTSMRKRVSPGKVRRRKTAVSFETAST